MQTRKKTIMQTRKKTVLYGKLGIGLFRYVTLVPGEHMKTLPRPETP